MNGTDNIRLALHPRVLELIIFPTEKCNFRCTYCYEDFEIGKMKRPIIEGIKNLIDARIDRKSLDALNLSWFGGEPTLASDVVLEISQHAMDHANGERLKQLTGGLTTNGYRLDRKLLTALVAVNQKSYQVSFDGYGKGHDETRRYASGKGTFDVIWKNMIAAHRTDLEFEMLLRLHQTDSNGESMSALTDAIIREFKGEKRLTVFFKSVENLGGPNADKLGKVNVNRIRTRVREMRGRLQDAGFRVTAVLEGPESSTEDEAPSASKEAPAKEVESRPVNSGSSTRGYAGYICYAAKPNSLIIRADGRVGKCTVMLNDDRNTLGRIQPDGTVTIDNERLRLWMRGFESYDPLEFGCPAQDLPKLESPAEVPLVRLRDLTGRGSAKRLQSA